MNTATAVTGGPIIPKPKPNQIFGAVILIGVPILLFALCLAAKFGLVTIPPGAPAPFCCLRCWSP